MDTKERLYYENQKIDISTLDNNLKKIKRKSIRQLGETFCQSLKLVKEMMMLPTSFLELLAVERSLVFYDTKARIIAKLRPGEYQEEYEKTAQRLIQEQLLPEKDKIAEVAIEEGKRNFIRMLERNELSVRETYEALLYSSSVWIWCNFEVLMRELWECSLNVSSMNIGGTVVKKLSSKDQRDKTTQGKYISLDYLAAHNYNISRKLGTALLGKFDFTSRNGILEAYNYAFPKSVNIKNVLSDNRLGELEATRNVIVHNAGIVDSEYCKRTSTSVDEIGKKLKINNQIVSEYGNYTIEAGLAVMLGVSSYIAHAKSRTKRG